MADKSFETRRTMSFFYAIVLASLTAQATAGDLNFGAWAPATFPNPQFDTLECGRPGIMSSWVCDPDSVISSASRDVVEGILQKISVGQAPYAKRFCAPYGVVGSQVAVALMKKFDVPAYSTPAPTAAVFAKVLHDTWGVGHPQCQDGVVLLVSTEDRQMYISTGTGVINLLSSSVVDSIIRTARPLLKANRFDLAVAGAAVDIGLALAQPERRNGDEKNLLALFIVLAVLAGIFCVIGLRACCVKTSSQNTQYVAVNQEPQPLKFYQTPQTQYQALHGPPNYWKNGSTASPYVIYEMGQTTPHIVHGGKTVAETITRSSQLANPAVVAHHMHSGAHGMKNPLAGGSTGGGEGGGW